MPDTPPTRLMTQSEFEDRLLDGDRWVELVEGRLIRLAPPDEAHGDIVRNLARSMALYLREASDLHACFELPLVVRREPLTIRCPAISVFQSGHRFSETDKVLTETRPILTIEIASTPERREAMSTRVEGYLDWGVTAVWVADPVSRHVHQFHGRSNRQMLKSPQVLLGQSVLPGYAIPIQDLFRELAPPQSVHHV